MPNILVVPTKASARNTLLNSTGETTIVTYTMLADETVRIQFFLRVITATTTVTVKIKYTDIDANAITYTAVDAENLAVGNYTHAPVFVDVKSGTAVSVTVQAGTANRVYASASIEELV